MRVRASVQIIQRENVVQIVIVYHVSTVLDRPVGPVKSHLSVLHIPIAKEPGKCVQMDSVDLHASPTEIAVVVEGEGSVHSNFVVEKDSNLLDAVTIRRYPI